MMVLRKVKNLGHLLLAVLANIYYRFPSRSIKVIGITGTDGKTTTTHLLYHILKTGGEKVSMVSTIGAKISDEDVDTGLHTTTPDPFFIQKLIRKSVDFGDEFFILEVTSHALDQNRVFGVKFKIGILTNITHEHLDYHENYEQYLKTKCLLLLKSEISIINEDDGSFNPVKKFLGDHKKKWYPYSLRTESQIKHFIEEELPRIAEYNKYNYMAAYLAAMHFGINSKKAQSALKTFRLPEGRLEVIYDKKIKIIVDFAHTPNAISSALKTIRIHCMKQRGELIHVFGSAGLRDSQKRPLMGESSSKFSDRVILTEEDYRTEDPFEICREIAAGLEKYHWEYVTPEKLGSIDRRKQYTVIIDRKKAIEKAFFTAKPGDVIVITGKGHERSLCRGKKEYPWSDTEAVVEMTKMM